MKIVVQVINLALAYFFTSSFLPDIGIIVGVIYVVVSALGIYYLRDKKIGWKFVNWQLIPLDEGIHDNEEMGILLSAAFLALGMKIGTALALAVSVSMTLAIAFCILLATGYIIEGRKSGMTVSGAWYIAKAVIWAYNKLNGLYDFIAQQIVKLEFYILKIDVKSK